MSSQTDQTQYTFSGHSAGGLVTDFIFVVSQGPGFGDTEAFALLTALNAAFPAGLLESVTVFKQRNVQTDYATNAAATPPSFT